MDDIEKIGRLETAMRTEAKRLRKTGGPSNIRASDALTNFVQLAPPESKLTLANILLEVRERSEERTRLRMAP